MVSKLSPEDFFIELKDVWYASRVTLKLRTEKAERARIIHIMRQESLVEIIPPINTIVIIKRNL